MPRPSEAILCIVAMLAEDVNGQAPRVALQVGDWQGNSFRKSGWQVTRSFMFFHVLSSFMFTIAASSCTPANLLRLS